jgi:hypothetical protein
MSALSTQLALVALTVLSAISESVFAEQLQHEPDATILSSPTPPSLAPEQMPSGPVIITYGNGELTIQALNSRLADVLRAVSRETGTSIEVPVEAIERVFGEFGPGPVANVLRSLLNGSHFNYVMVGRSDNPDALARVTLTPKPVDMASGKDQERGRHATVAAVEANSSHTEPRESVPARAQALPVPSSLVPLHTQNLDANFMNALATELGPEAADMDPEQKRALEAMLAQLKMRSEQDSRTAEADSGASAPIPSPTKKRSGRR